MIIHKVLNKLFSAPTSISVLRELSQRNVGLTGRELARLAGITPQAAHNALSNLEALKIVKREFAGRSHYFRLNRDHFLYKRIISSVFDSENEFVQSLFARIKKTLSKDCVSIILFGSVARKEEISGSDLDVCLVYANQKTNIEEKISLLRDELYNEYGVTLAPYYISLTEFKKRAKLNKSPIDSIIKEGRVLSGKTIQRIIHG